MAELNDKLITYGNLSTFYDKLQEQGLGGNAIVDVSVLPDASANKNKFVRLTSDKKVYVSELVGTSTEEVVAPDSEQIDNAYITDTGDYFYYKGTATIIDSSNQQTYNVYRWYDDDNNLNLFTVYDAYTILNYALEYGEPYDESKLEYYTDEIQAYNALLDEGGKEIPNFFNVWTDLGNNTFTGKGINISTVVGEGYNIVKINKSTEVIEEWDWQPFTDNATNDDIDLMFATPESPIVKRVLMKDSEDYGYSINEGWINFNDETMSYDGGTYYKWLKYSEREGEAVQDDNYYILTNTLNPTLPFTVNSDECVYCFEIEDEGETYRIEHNETYSKIALIHEDGSITYEE